MASTRPCPWKSADPAEVGRGRGEDVLDPLGPADELAPDRQERGDDAGHVRRGHAGAAVLDVVDAPAAAAPLAPSAAFAPAAADRMRSPGATRSGLARPSPVGPLRGEVRDAVDVRRVAVGGPDRDGQLGVARVVDGERPPGRAGHAAERVLRLGVAGVAGGDDDDDAAADQPVDLDAQRALPAREPLRVEVVAEAEVDAVDAQAAAVVVDLLDRVERGEDGAGAADPVVVEHLVADDGALRRDAGDGR